MITNLGMVCWKRLGNRLELVWNLLQICDFQMSKTASQKQPQLTTHAVKSLTFTAYDAKWIPASAKYGLQLFPTI